MSEEEDCIKCIIHKLDQKESRLCQENSRGDLLPFMFIKLSFYLTARCQEVTYKSTNLETEWNKVFMANSFSYSLVYLRMRMEEGSWEVFCLLGKIVTCLLPQYELECVLVDL